MEIIILVIVGLCIGGALLGPGGAVMGAALALLYGKIRALAKMVLWQHKQLEEILEARPKTATKKTVDKPATVDQSVAETVEPVEKIEDKRIPLADRLPPLDLEQREELTQIKADAHAARPISAIKKPTKPVEAQLKPKSISPLVELKNKFLESTNLVTRAGIVILFFGVGFLLRFATENIEIPIEVKLLGVAIAGLAIFFLGIKQTKPRPEFSTLLQGTAIGIWYLTTFASMGFYEVINPTTGFMMMFALSIFSALLSVLKDAKALAIFGILGGFLAPVLASTGEGSHVMLFTYYVILNIGILSIVWYKQWRVLTLMGFVFTFLVATIWGANSYTPQNFSSTEPFLLVFIIFYIAVSMIFALRKKWAHSSVLDGPIVFGTPVIGFFLQTQLVSDFEYGLAWSSLGLGIAYLSIVAIWWKALCERSPLLRESFLCIGIIFVSLSIPYTFDYDVTAILWTMEGAGGLWLAVRQQRLWATLLSLLALIAAGASWLIDIPSAGDNLFINTGFISAISIAAIGFYSAWLLQSQPDTFLAKKLSNPMLAWALIWWFGTYAWQIDAHLSGGFAAGAALLVVSFSSVALQTLRTKLKWNTLESVIAANLPAVLAICYFSFHTIDHPFQDIGFIAWPISIFVLYRSFFTTNIFKGKLASMEVNSHGATFALVLTLLVWETLWQVGQLTQLISWKIIAAGVVILLSTFVLQKLSFVKATLRKLYQDQIIPMLIFTLIANFIVTCFVNPNLSPLSYIPILNPLDIWQLLIIVTFGLWLRRMNAEGKLTNFTYKDGLTAIGGMLVVFTHMLMLRTLHLTANIPFEIEALAKADIVQTGLSILWTSIGIALFFGAKKYEQRQLWLMGMSVFGIVVAKLFLVDLGNSDTVERIVSFIVVGILLLGVGYFVPVPASKDGKNISNESAS
jgi:uncharacterized membrane protein